MYEVSSGIDPEIFAGHDTNDRHPRENMLEERPIELGDLGDACERLTELTLNDDNAIFEKDEVIDLREASPVGVGEAEPD